MSNILKQILIVFFVCGLTISSNLSAQERYAKEYEQQGDKAMKQHSYSQAYNYYLLGRKFVKQNLSLMYKCGEACLAMNDYDKAEYWYQKVLIENDSLDINKSFPYLYLHLAKSSICNGNIIQAQSFLNTCLLDCDNIEIRHKCKQELQKIDWIIDNDSLTNYTIINLGKNINDETSQTNTFIIRDSLMIYTTYEYKTQNKDGQVYYSDVYNRLYYSFIDDLYYTKGKPLNWNGINKKKTNVADLFLDTISMTAYFTYAHFVNNKKLTSIYYATFDNKKNKWTKPKVFEPLKDKQHSYSHPVVVCNNGEKIMYFASDRKGGYGKMDIWYLDMNSQKNEPVNLGPTINTSGDEITPFYYSKDNLLYFASDTHKGFGGFDIFVCKGWKTSWQEVHNCMKPINSPANDMYPFVCNDGLRGYFTSNRPSPSNVDNKTCCNDIYRFDYVEPQQPLAQKTVQPTNNPEKQIITNKPSFDISKDIPLALYFHNDSPDAGSELTTTQLSYADCYKLYLSLTNQYKAGRTKGMDDSTAHLRLTEIDSFMNNKLRYGMEKLNQALDYILSLLDSNKFITIQIRGYASSLYETDYNKNLAERRIVSVENYIRSYKSGKLSAYMDNVAKDNKPMLEIQHLAIGKLESSSPNPNTLEEKRSSVYLPSSMEERRIEIREIQIRN